MKPWKLQCTRSSSPSTDPNLRCTRNVSSVSDLASLKCAQHVRSRGSPSWVFLSTESAAAAASIGALRQPASASLAVSPSNIFFGRSRVVRSFGAAIGSRTFGRFGSVFSAAASAFFASRTRFFGATNAASRAARFAIFAASKLSATTASAASRALRADSTRASRMAPATVPSLATATTA